MCGYACCSDCLPKFRGKRLFSNYPGMELSIIIMYHFSSSLALFRNTDDMENRLNMHVQLLGGFFFLGGGGFVVESFWVGGSRFWVLIPLGSSGLACACVRV